MELTRLRALAPADHDSLTDAEHLAVLDAADLLDELRAGGYAFALTAQGRTRATTPDGAPPPKDVAGRVAALAGAIVYVLRIEAQADPLPDGCRRCGAPVWQYTPGGHAYCEQHYRIAKARALLQVADADLARQAGERRRREEARQQVAPHPPRPARRRVPAARDAPGDSPPEAAGPHLGDAPSGESGESFPALRAQAHPPARARAPPALPEGAQRQGCRGLRQLPGRGGLRRR
jgi:hypothetical protein